MTVWKPIADPGLRAALERYRQETGRDLREDHPDLDGEEGLLGVYLIMPGYQLKEAGTVVSFARDPKGNSGGGSNG